MNLMIVVSNATGWLVFGGGLVYGGPRYHRPIFKGGLVFGGGLVIGRTRYLRRIHGVERMRMGDVSQT